MATTTSVAKLNTGKTQERDVGESLTKVAVRRLRRDKLTLLAIAVIIVITLLSVFAGPISSALNVSFDKTNATQTFLQPLSTSERNGITSYHLLGTDDLGRDQFSRLLYAGQVSLSVGFLAAFLSLTIGVTLGIITGYYGGLADDFTNWVIATLTSIPSLFLLLIVAAVLQPTPTTLILVLGLLGWTGTTRLVRGETLSLREREYTVSAKAIGASDRRIMFQHILPNVFSIIVITLAIDIGALILAEAALSFLGLGIKPPIPSWGNMLSKSQEFFTRGPFLVWPPGIMIFLTVLCMYVIGDGVRDAFDPTSKDK